MNFPASTSAFVQVGAGQAHHPGIIAPDISLEIVGLPDGAAALGGFLGLHVLIGPAVEQEIRNAADREGEAVRGSRQECRFPVVAIDAGIGLIHGAMIP
jgi:hypothetical protein